MRVAIIGARRTRQGTGPFLARFLAQAGADVDAVLGTSPATAEAAALALLPDVGRTPVPYTDVEACLAHPDLDAVVIASPYRTHEAYLERALAARLHVLCEKPLVWGGDAPAAAAERLAVAFLEAGLWLRVNAQWPFTLPTYRALFPQAAAVPQRFAMRLAPRVGGLEALVESLSHPLSLLACLIEDPAADLADITFEGLTPSSPRSLIRFRYLAGGHAIACEIELVTTPQPPRTMGYALDGAWALRHVEIESGRYARMTLEGGGRRIPLPDPTPSLVGSFVDAVAAGPPTATDPAAIPGMRHLDRLLRGAADILGAPDA